MIDLKYFATKSGWTALKIKKGKQNAKDLKKTKEINFSGLFFWVFMLVGIVLVVLGSMKEFSKWYLGFVLIILAIISLSIGVLKRHCYKIYFYDNGIRNALISNFSDISIRQDIGALWENYLVSERIKYNQYNSRYVNNYFWRTAQMQEIDYLEESDGILSAYEFKWNPKKSAKTNLTFRRAYPNVPIVTITRDNYIDFLQ